MHRVQHVQVPQSVVVETLRALRAYGARRLEGLVLWLGTIHATTAVVQKAYVPDQHPIADEHGVGYFVEGETLFRLNQAMAEEDVRLIAQVHSHPGEAYHSAADDRYAIVTAEGGLSLVVPDFGHASADLSDWAMYRLTEGHWRELSGDDITAMFKIGEAP